MSEEVKNTDYVLEVENLHTCFHTAVSYTHLTLPTTSRV